VSKWEDQEQMVADGAERVSIREVLRSAEKRHRGSRAATGCPACGEPLSDSGRCANPPCDYYRVPASAVRILEANGGAHQRAQAYQRYRDHLQAEARRHDRGARVTSGKEARAWLEEDRAHFSHTYYG
jgi:hypothetical protein